MTVALRTLNHFLHRRVWGSAHLTAEIPQYDLRLEVSPADVIGRHLYKYRRYEPELTTTLARHLELGSADLMVDIGANIGWYALLVTRLSEGRCRVIAFEPDPQNYALLKRNLALNGATQVQAFNLAVGDAADTLRLHRYGHDNAGRHSLLALHAGETIPVQVVALNEFWRTQQLPEGPIRLMKMDIEGYEVIGARSAVDRSQQPQWAALGPTPLTPAPAPAPAPTGSAGSFDGRPVAGMALRTVVVTSADLGLAQFTQPDGGLLVLPAYVLTGEDGSTSSLEAGSGRTART